ncbi:Biogenesis of lysosome-related organelles complex 1 subunit [Lachnellula hyalina]|uniref:Biogenesis of lysosome-related organelles complex 1 subunit KXD1 n=1 Tax=Lachnellula hyalina TaxID=1316788 RepID=A0A8H8QZW9_9HELO|nr:Biogenesis of lysosome-related organelles complex 1 subunit [Lachnellula hyalina]TVY25531.1 Biogenesis of lysosome-related organelles complex 1 subunit [Lachnellula hyalina]
MAYPQTYYQTTSLPISVPSKSQNAQYYTPQNHGYSVSPPEVAESVTTGASMTPAYGNSTYSATSNSYAGSSSSEYDSTSSANGVDMQEYMQDRFNGAFDPLPLDRTLAVQAQTSGLLNAKHRELQDLQALAQQRLARSRARLAEGYQDAKEVKRDLEWTQKRVSTMKTKASRKHPKEYKQARARYPSPEY